MYRNRARAAHVLQSSAPLVPQGQGAPVGSQGAPAGDHSAPVMPQGHNVPGPPGQSAPGFNGQPFHSQPDPVSAVPFFNPMSYQNGHLEPPFSQQQQVKGKY